MIETGKVLWRYATELAAEGLITMTDEENGLTRLFLVQAEEVSELPPWDEIEEIVYE